MVTLQREANAMRLPNTLVKAWRWVRHDVPDPDPDTLGTSPLVEWLKDQETAARFSVRHDKDYLENLMVYRDRIAEGGAHDRRNPD